jgi:hypothetical protein
MVKNILYLSIFTFIVILSWIAFGVYHNHTTTTISNDAQILITPIEPNFDNATIDRIRQRTVVEANLNTLRVDITISPSPGQATGPAILEPQQATGSAPFVPPSAL